MNGHSYTQPRRFVIDINCLVNHNSLKLNYQGFYLRIQQAIEAKFEELTCTRLEEFKQVHKPFEKWFKEEENKNKFILENGHHLKELYDLVKSNQDFLEVFFTYILFEGAYEFLKSALKKGDAVRLHENNKDHFFSIIEEQLHQVGLIKPNNGVVYKDYTIFHIDTNCNFQSINVTLFSETERRKEYHIGDGIYEDFYSKTWIEILNQFGFGKHAQTLSRSLYSSNPAELAASIQRDGDNDSRIGVSNTQISGYHTSPKPKTDIKKIVAFFDLDDTLTETSIFCHKLEDLEESYRSIYMTILDNITDITEEQKNDFIEKFNIFFNDNKTEYLFKCMHILLESFNQNSKVRQHFAEVILFPKVLELFQWLVDLERKCDGLEVNICIVTNSYCNPFGSIFREVMANNGFNFTQVTYNQSPNSSKFLYVGLESADETFHPSKKYNSTDIIVNRDHFFFVAGKPTCYMAGKAFDTLGMQYLTYTNGLYLIDQDTTISIMVGDLDTDIQFGNNINAIPIHSPQGVDEDTARLIQRKIIHKLQGTYPELAKELPEQNNAIISPSPQRASSSQQRSL